jgi:hypothetical protein
VTITVNKSIQVAAAIAARQAEVNDLYAQKMAAGYVYQGHTYQIDAKAQSNMQAVFLELIAGIATPSSGVWRDLANIDVAFSDADLKVFLLAAAGYIKGVLYAAWAQKDAIKNLTTLADIAAHDITTGWP